MSITFIYQVSLINNCIIYDKCMMLWINDNTSINMWCCEVNWNSQMVDILSLLMYSTYLRLFWNYKNYLTSNYLNLNYLIFCHLKYAIIWHPIIWTSIIWNSIISKSCNITVDMRHEKKSYFSHCIIYSKYYAT